MDTFLSKKLMMALVLIAALAFLAACTPDIVPGAGPTDNLPGGTDDTGTPPAVDADNDGYVEGTDCDDTDPAVGDPSDWYPDADNDGYGNAYTVKTVTACDQPKGHVADSTDCDDENADVNPGESEICDDIDNDCSGVADDVVDNVWYFDQDLDGYGSDIAVVDGCEIETEGPGQWVAQTGDCDDLDPEVNPDAEEICDDVDNDCDGSIDPSTSTDATAWFADEDGDSYGDVDEYEIACEAPEGFVGDWSDCNDANPLVNPGETEVCDGVDNDCDGTADETDGNPDVLTLWDDDDADGFGDDAAGSFVACPADGFVEQGGDCDDGDPAISPDADEICDGLDNDCDEVIDPDNSLDVLTWYADADGDGWGECLEDTDACTSTLACDQPTGYVDTTGDCDDTDADVNPGEAEVCNDVDDDCDGTTDVGATDAGTWYPDSDGDSFGNASGTVVTQCDQPSSHVADSTDCDDWDSASYPGADEYCDGADNDCDGVTDSDSSVDATAWYDDNDTDGFGDADSSSVSCTAPSGTVSDATDCDDTDSSVYPGADEYCDTQDNDCDGDIDEEAGDTYYADTDGDGYGDPDAPQEDCSDPDGYVEDMSDCDDTNEFVHPDSIEVCSDSSDNDCDGDTDSSPCVTEGSYTGTFAIELTETTYGLGSDSCDGTASLVVDTTASPMISGTVECAFVGDAAAYLSDTYVGTVEGDFDSDLVPSGSVDFSSFGWAFDWDDNGSGDTNVNGEFSGSDTYTVLGVPLDFDYTGDFATDYTP